MPKITLTHVRLRRQGLLLWFSGKSETIIFPKSSHVVPPTIPMFSSAKFGHEATIDPNWNSQISWKLNDSLEVVYGLSNSHNLFVLYFDSLYLIFGP